MDSELQSLRKELTDLEDELGQKVKQLGRRIEVLESKEALSQFNEFADSTQTPAEKPVIPSVDLTIDDIITPKETAKSTPKTIAPISARTTQASRSATPIPQEPAQPSTTKKRELVKDVSKVSFFATIAPLLGPLAGLLEQFFKLYGHYQKQGKAPVFFMTLTGVVALVVGFGYLLQFSFNEYLGPVGKVLFGFAIAIGTTVGGVRFTKKRPDMAEYGSSLIALGVVLNYLCAYFAGPYYGLLPDLAGFLLLVAVTAFAYVLALLFETRIVAIVTLVGGAAMPLVMGHMDTSPLLYLSYLLVLVCAMLSLSHRIRWQQLALVSMVLSAGMVEFSIANMEVLSGIGYSEPYGLIAVIHGFFYVFGFYALRGLSSASAMTKERLIIVTANILFYLFVTQQLVAGSTLLGIIYLLNVLVWTGVFLVPHKVFRYSMASDEFRAVQGLALLQGGLLAGVGILVLSSPELMGVVWCLEALMLVYLGGKFGFLSVRVEGYIALLISLLTMGFQVAEWVADASVSDPQLLDLSMGMGWANLIAITLLIFGGVTLLKRQQDDLTDHEHQLTSVLDNLFSVCLSLSFMLTLGIFWPEGMWLFAPIPMFYLIWRAQSKALVFTELFGLSHFLLILIPVVVSAGVAGNFHFSEQSIYGQIARVETFLCLWLIAEFYKRFCTESPNFGFTEGLRKLFYCLIPVFFLPSTLRQHSEAFALALWLSSAMSLFLYYRLQYTVLKYEFRLLVIVASVMTIGGGSLAVLGIWQGHAFAALAVGLGFYLITGWMAQGLRRKPIGSDRIQQLHGALKPLFTVAVYYFAIALFIVSYRFLGNVEMSMLMVIVYLTVLFFYQPVLAPIRSNLRLMYGLILSLCVFLTISQANSVSTGHSNLALGLLACIGVFCAGLLVYRTEAQNRVVWPITGGKIPSIGLFNLISIVAYISLLSQLFTTMLGPVISIALVVHATIILFQTIKPEMKKLIWLALALYGVAAIKVLLWDMNDFSLVQKIVVFMIIGLCMLGAAFKFQKVTARNENVT